MKYCVNCKNQFDTEEKCCPNCGAKLMPRNDRDKINEYKAAEIISSVTKVFMITKEKWKALKQKEHFYESNGK